MSFQVDWLARAERELVEIWLDARDRQRITEAANVIDRELKTRGPAAGESRYSNVRILLEEPLGILFYVDAKVTRLAVTHVWRY